jgi:hypothetical protein
MDGSDFEYTDELIEHALNGGSLTNEEIIAAIYALYKDFSRPDGEYYNRLFALYHANRKASALYLREALEHSTPWLRIHFFARIDRYEYLSLQELNEILKRYQGWRFTEMGYSLLVVFMYHYNPKTRTHRDLACRNPN